MSEQLLFSIKNTADKLIRILSSFEQEQINVSPFKGSWTAAQVADHLLKSDTGVVEVLYGKVKETQRQPDEKVSELRDLFLNFTIKMESPVEILPSDQPQQKEKVLQALETRMETLYEAAAILNLAESCVSFAFPGSGFLTRLEWLSFFVFHTQRHTYQIENIFQTIKK
ncbi:DinB family protein [Catalinimonas niigatensis]|uniref:DinB family protein n=1 Tax=Catalinimonas niigatensis TaxID=1397264 RepID=UPI002665BA48|nr:DinB family protein [Catalinimonas niigatensis]WPP53034.1 DinB family protein [Catalinimonas niigatensis]